MRCEDCIHYELCSSTYEHIFGNKYQNEVETICETFKDKSLFVELPCKVGDTVYVPWRWGDQQAVASVKVEEIKFYDTQMHYMFLIDMESDDESFNQEFGGWKIDQSIGETVFLTREEAEKRLKEIQE